VGAQTVATPTFGPGHDETIQPKPGKPHRARIVGAGMIVAAVLALAALLVVRRADSTVHGTVNAQAVVDSMGVDVHLSYLDTAYGRFPEIESRLKALGIRNVRDGACAGCLEENQRLKTLAAQGVRSDLIMGSPMGTYGTVPQLLGLLRGPLSSSVVSVEGPNEYDVSGDRAWLPHVWAYQQGIYSAIKRDPVLKRLPVLGPSFVSAGSYRRFGAFAGTLDAVNLHSYPPSGSPPDSNVQRELGIARGVAAAKPVIATETGYRTGGPPLPGNLPVSEALEAVYLPELYLEYFRSGFQRTFVYELVDEKPDPAGLDPEQHFGLLHNDLTPKPAYRAVQNLIAVLSAGGRASTGLRPPDARLTVPDATPEHSLVAQRADGAQVLAMWPPVPDANGAPGGRSSHLAVITLATPAPVEVYRPTQGTSPQARYASTGRLTVALGPDVTLAVIHPHP